jgi:hypothetical protein
MSYLYQGFECHWDIVSYQKWILFYSHKYNSFSSIFTHVIDLIKTKIYFKCLSTLKKILVFRYLILIYKCFIAYYDKSFLFVKSESIFIFRNIQKSSWKVIEKFKVKILCYKIIFLFCLNKSLLQTLVYKWFL